MRAGGMTAMMFVVLSPVSPAFESERELANAPTYANNAGGICAPGGVCLLSQHIIRSTCSVHSLF